MSTETIAPLVTAEKAAQPLARTAIPMTLDVMRSYGAVHPPEQLACADGESVPVAFEEERPTVFRNFMKRAEDGGHEVTYKTRCYEQDGFSFDANFKHIPETLDLAGRARANKLAAEKEAKKAARKAHDEYMRAQGFKPGQYVEFEDAVTEEPTAADVGRNIDTSNVKNTFDLIGWYHGRVHAPWFTVAAAFKEQHSFSPRTAENGREFLIENRIVSE